MELAEQAGLKVRVVGGLADPELGAPQTSAVCRVKGRVWVVLAAQDPVAGQLEVLSEALRTHAADYIEAHFLPPAVRQQLGSATDAPQRGG
jgi:hypothetical protein